MSLNKKNKFLIFLMIAIVLVILIAICHKKDPYIKEQWALNFLDYESISKIYKKNANHAIKIAVIDTYIDNSHEDLVDNITMFNATKKITNIDGHGTMISGIIKAKQNNRKGIYGLADYKEIELIGIEVVETNSKQQTQGSTNNILWAIKKAEQLGCKVCSISINYDEYNKEISDVIKNSKMLFVVSAGNSEGLRRINIDKKKTYPACYEFENILCVTSINNKRELSSWANYGELNVDIAAPGENILTTSPGDQYAYCDGTSYSVAYVTAIASLMFSIDDTNTAEELRSKIITSATFESALVNKVHSEGILNGEKALTLCIEE